MAGGGWRIHKFSDDEAVDLRQVNEEALQLYARAKELCAARWTHFCFPLRFDTISQTSSTNTEDRTYKIKAPWAWEIEEIEIFARDATNTGMVLSVATTGVTGVQDASVTVDATDTLFSDVSAPNAEVSANTEVTFTLSNSTGNAPDIVYAVVRGRTNPWGTLAIPAPPQVKDGETISATEWNTWFSNMASTLTTAQTNAAERRVIELHEFYPTAFCDMVFPPRGNVTAACDLDAMHVYVGSAGVAGLSCSLRYYFSAANNHMAGNGSGGALACNTSAGSLTRTELTVEDSTCKMNDLDDPANQYMEITTASYSGTITRAYAVLFWGK